MRTSIHQQMGHSSARSIGSTLQLEILLVMPNAWKSRTVQSTPILTPSSPTISCHIHKLSVSPFFSFLKHYSLPSAPLSTPPPRLFPTWSIIYTGNSLPLTATPALSTSTPIHGPIIGIFLANPAIVPRKSPNRINIPYNSTKKPINAHLMRMRNRPMKNAAVPLSFWRRAKKRRVFCGPIIIVRPIRKRI